jgi:hypothetical protein
VQTKAKIVEVIRMWQEAKHQGHGGAQFVVGCAYYHGAGANKWYRKAADQGHAGAQ